MTPDAMDGHETAIVRCESLYVIHLYLKIAKRRAEKGEGILVRAATYRSNNLTSTRPQNLQEATIPDCTIVASED
jgi:hypothetical protein